MALQYPLPAEPSRTNEAVPPAEHLATALLDLESGYEGALRTVLSVHRLLEDLRCNAQSPARTLLVQEMSRKIAALQASAIEVDDRLDAVSRLIALLPSQHGE